MKGNLFIRFKITISPSNLMTLNEVVNRYRLLFCRAWKFMTRKMVKLIDNLS